MTVAELIVELSQQPQHAPVRYRVVREYDDGLEVLHEDVTGVELIDGKVVLS